MLDIGYNISIISKFKHCIQWTFNTWSYMLYTGNRTNFTLIVSVAHRFVQEIQWDKAYLHSSRKEGSNFNKNNYCYR